MTKDQNPVIVRNARIFTPVDFEGATATWKTVTFSPGAMAIVDGRIKAIGPEPEILAQFPPSDSTRLVDAGGQLLTPGFVDCHTHPVFYNHRAHEFEMRVKGATYLDIAKSGGGIRFSVRDLRQASEEELLLALLPRLDRFVAHGTTTIEAKSGYGLSREAEIKSLRVLQIAAEVHPIDIVPTFLGAHEIPDEHRQDRNRYLQIVIDEMVPYVAENRLAVCIDVFCENHVFTAEESRRVLLAGKSHGLRPKIHADQLHDSGGAAIAVEVGAVSADHLEHTPPEMDERLLHAGVTPVMLPGADFFIASPLYGPARRMIAAGLPVALSTDFNPGTCMSESMPMMLTLGCLQLKMAPAEVMVAATLHAAKAIACENEIGSLEIGKWADFVIWEATTEVEIPYHFGVNLVQRVYKKGRMIYEKQPIPN